MKNVYEDFSMNKENFDFSNYSSKSKYHDDSNAVCTSFPQHATLFKNTTRNKKSISYIRIWSIKNG